MRFDVAQRPISLRHCGLLIAALAANSPSLAAASDAPRCMTRIIADVRAEEAPEQMKSKSNGSFGPITQVKVNRATGRMTYCAKGSYCYWSNAFEFVSACRLKRDDRGDQTYFSYGTR